jgi:hypothetical protein
MDPHEFFRQLSHIKCSDPPSAMTPEMLLKGGQSLTHSLSELLLLYRCSTWQFADADCPKDPRYGEFFEALRCPNVAFPQKSSLDESFPLDAAGLETYLDNVNSEIPSG